MAKGNILYNKAKKIIPGGTQLLSKRPEMFLPEHWPSYYKKAKGCEIWDLDNKKYIDMSYMGIGACILGYADPDVNREVLKAVKRGNISTLNCTDEVELAELLCEIHPWADMVRYARTGGEALTIAVRIARTKTRKDKILFCGYHGWHDWYLASNLADDSALDGHLLPGLEPAGVPRVLKGTTYPFAYNNTDEFLYLLKKYREDIGAVVLEPIRNIYPENNFLNIIREKCTENKIVLIVDEVSSGFRLTIGGAHLVLNLEPDLAVFSKGISNGYPMAAIIGKKHIMDSAQNTFISSTYWTEKIGPAAALASIKKMKEKEVYKHLEKIGKKIKAIWRSQAKNIQLNIDISGIDPLAHFEFKNKFPLKLKTLFTQFMLDLGILATNSFYASYAHKTKHTEKFNQAVGKAFSMIKKAIDSDKIDIMLKGPVCHSGFKRLT